MTSVKSAAVELWKGHVQSVPLAIVTPMPHGGYSTLSGAIADRSNDPDYRPPPPKAGEPVAIPPTGGVLPPFRAELASASKSRRPSRRGPVARASALDGCAYPSAYAYKWPRQHLGGAQGYIVNPNYSRPAAGWTQDNLIRFMIYGHNTWQNTINPCGYHDQNNVAFVYQGRTGAHWNQGDNANVIDFGDIPAVGGSSDWDGMQNNRYFPCAGGWQCIIDSDMRFQWTRSWGACAPCSAAFTDMWSFAAHETGHSMGLAHTGYETQTMNHLVYTDSRARDLGAGDVWGMRTQNPG